MMRFEPVLPSHYFEQQGPRFIPEIGVLFFIKVSTLSIDGDKGLYGADILSFDSKDGKPIPLLSRLIPSAEAAVFEDVVKKFAAKIRNTSLYHFKASGYVEMKNVFGKQVARVELPARYLLPNRNRSFDIEVIKETQSFWQRHSFFGPYTATLVLNIPGQEIPAVMREKFWVFPWKEALAALFIFGLFALLRGRIWKSGKALLVGSK